MASVLPVADNTVKVRAGSHVREDTLVTLRIETDNRGLDIAVALLHGGRQVVVM